MTPHATKRQVLTNSNETPCHQKTSVHKRNKELKLYSSLDSKFFMTVLFFVGDTMGEDEVVNNSG
jgi:hypothetical protein